jgi:hypothetical protein
MAFQNVLPNPSNGIAYDGTSGTGKEGYAVGPGYASVNVKSKFQTAKDTTNSGVLVSRAKASQNFEVSIKYNPMTEAEFMPVYSFLLEKQGMLKSFFVPLPQYDDPQDSSFISSPEKTFTVSSAASAGATKVNLSTTSYNPATDGQLRPGDMITFSDSNDSNHLKAYKITRVETADDYENAVSANAIRLHLSPSLRKDVSTSATLVYRNPKMKVIMSSDVVSYELGTNNLYSFSLNLEEVQ